MYNNKAEIICIDNWSLFNGPKEEFLKNSRILSDLKLRMSYGVVGNEGIPPFSSL